MSETQIPLTRIKDYYGNILQTNRDLKTNACCVAEILPTRIRAILHDIHPEVLDKFYGCGSPIPPVLDGQTVLDLGSGSGRDCFIFSKLVGDEGRVIGVDMTQNQIAIAKKHIDYHMDKFGYTKPNVEFHGGYIEDLETLGIANQSIDIVISNCVLNLSLDKERVFSEIFRVLKPGGELYFSDVFTGQRIPNELKKDPVLLGECLAGAFYVEDFRRLLAKIGCQDYRIVSKSKIVLTDAEIERKIGMIDFYSMTVRAFKLDLEDRCEDYGQVAYYQGSLAECPHAFTLDDHHVFKTGQPVRVCGNTASMLCKTRFAPHFCVVGDTKKHYGLFDCRTTPILTNTNTVTSGACC